MINKNERVNEMTQFKTNTTYGTTSICDSNCLFKFKILKRTAKTVTIKVHGEITRKRIFDYDGREAMKPLGSYSMAPIVTATDYV